MQLPYANLKMRHWNPGATMPLMLPVHVICNTSDELLYGNIEVNSRRPGQWQKVVPEHDGVAVLCGSGPSLADHLDVIFEMQQAGGKVFAMNGAAKYLKNNGIYPDYQVIVDARAETAQLVGPAKQHLFASQVHPDCFAKAPLAKVWHLQIGDIEDHFPEYKSGYCLIGGAASVGNCTTCLAYAMGYRDLQIFGYDSSNRDDRGHAFSQPMNDGDPQCVVKFDGKEYTTSLTMKLQAEKFQETSQALIEAGCEIVIHGDGLLPAMFYGSKEAIAEAAKYEAMWETPEYRNLSPGELAAGDFLEVVKPKPGASIIDFGCGTGRGALRLNDLGYLVTMVDFAGNCLDDAAKAITFVKADLTKPLHLYSQYGYCTDVLEHIPTDDVEAVVRNVMGAAALTYFQISTVPDNMGVLIGHALHLTVKPHHWWRLLFVHLGYSIKYEKEDAINSTFVVEHSQSKENVA